MTGLGLAEQLQRGFALGEGGDEIGFGGLAVGVKIAGAQRLALAQAGVDDDAVQPTQFFIEGAEDFEDLIVVADIQRLDGHGDAGVGGFQFGLQRFQPVRAPRAQRQVAALCGELAGHLLAQSRAGAGDQDGFSVSHGGVLDCRGGGRCW